MDSCDGLRVMNIFYIRYVDMKDIEEYGLEMYHAFHYIKTVSKRYGRFVDRKSFEEHLLGHAFSETMTVDYNYDQLTDWNALKNLITLYLSRVISSTPFYTCPYSRETTYILPELLKILDTDILPLDSEPGFFIEDIDINTSYLQLPYLEILAPLSELHKIIKGFKRFIVTSQSYHVKEDKVLSTGNIFDNGIFTKIILVESKNPGSKYISIAIKEGEIINNYDDFLKNNFDSLNISYSVGSIMFGVKMPDNIDMLGEFLEYIFTNAFFDDIRTIIELGSIESS
jgi:hypothetical protein